MEDSLISESLEFETQTDIITLLENVKCQGADPSGLKQALLALATICSSRVESQDYFRLAGGVDELKSILLEGSCPVLAVPSALFCLACAVKQNVTSQNAVLTKDLLTVIHELLSHKDSDEKIVQAAAFLLACAVSGSGRGQCLAFETKCLQDLLNHLRNCVIEKYQDECLWSAITRAIGVCVNNPQNEKNQQICSCILPHALKMIREEERPEPIRHVLTLIGSVVANNASNQARICQCGGIETLICFIKNRTHHQDVALQYSLIACAVSALDACFAENEESGQRAGKLKLVPLLLDLLEDKGFEKNDVQILVLTLAHVLELAREHCHYVREGRGYQLLVSFLTETQEDELFKVIKYILTICKTGDEEIKKRPKVTDEEDKQEFEESINHLTSSLHKKLADLQNQLHEIGHLSETFNSVHTVSNFPHSLPTGDFGDSTYNSPFYSTTDPQGCNRNPGTRYERDEYISSGENYARPNTGNKNLNFNNHRLFPGGSEREYMYGNADEINSPTNHTQTKEYGMYEDGQISSAQCLDSIRMDKHSLSLRTHHKISSHQQVPSKLAPRKFSQFQEETNGCDRRNVCSIIEGFKKTDEQRMEDVSDNYSKFQRVNNSSKKWDTSANSQCLNCNFDSRIASPHCQDLQEQNVGSSHKGHEHFGSGQRNYDYERLNSARQSCHQTPDTHSAVEKFMSHENVQLRDKDNDNDLNGGLHPYMDNVSRQQKSASFYNSCSEEYLIEKHNCGRQSPQRRCMSLSSRNKAQSPLPMASNVSKCPSPAASSHIANFPAAGSSGVQSVSDIFSSNSFSMATLQENQVHLFGQFQKMMSSFFSSLMPDQLKKAMAFPVISDPQNSNDLVTTSDQNPINDEKKNGENCENIEKSVEESDCQNIFLNPGLNGNRHSSPLVALENSFSASKKILTAPENIPTGNNIVYENNEESESNNIFQTHALNRNVSKPLPQNDEHQGLALSDIESQKRRSNEDTISRSKNSYQSTPESCENEHFRSASSKTHHIQTKLTSNCPVEMKSLIPPTLKHLEKLDNPFLKPLLPAHCLSVRSTANQSARKLTSNIMSASQAKRSKTCCDSTSRFCSPPQSPALSQFDNCLKKMAQKNASTYDKMQRKTTESQKASYDSVTSGIDSMVSAGDSSHGNKSEDSERERRLCKSSESSCGKTIIPLQRKNVRHVCTLQKEKRGAIEHSKKNESSVEQPLDKSGYAVMKRDSNPPKYSQKSLCPGCSAGFELNSRTYNLAVETSVHTCSYHRTLRQCERELISRNTKRLKPLDGIDAALNGCINSEEKEKDVYDFTSDSAKTLSSPCIDESINSVLRATFKKCQGGEVKQERRPRIPYTEQELQNLMDGVARMGKRWQNILCTYEFHPCRTSVDLKDKYKRLTTTSRVKPEPRRSHQPFSMCEIRRLKRGIKSFGYNWKAILTGYRFLPGRRAVDLQNKWKALNKMG